MNVVSFSGKRPFTKKLENDLIAGWNQILETVSDSADVDRVIWTTWFDDEESPTARVAGPQDPGGRKSDPILVIDFPFTCRMATADHPNLFKKTPSAEIQIQEWVCGAIKASWNSEKIKKLRSRLLEKRKLAVFAAESDSDRKQGKIVRIAGSKIADKTNLPEVLIKFAALRATHVFHMFIVKKGKIVEVDFSDPDYVKFFQIDRDFFGEFQPIGEAIMREHGPRKLFLNKSRPAHPDIEKKICKLLKIDKPTYLSESQSEKRHDKIAYQQVCGDVEWLVDVESLF